MDINITEVWRKAAVTFDEMYAQLPERAGVIGWELVAVGLVLLAVQSYRRWKRKKGYRMILKDRNDKKHAFLLDILTDAFEEAERVGKFSRDEINDLYAMCQQRLGLNDLVPKKRIARQVKASLKKDRILRDKARADGSLKAVKLP